jgi:hypothetical protein
MAPAGEGRVLIPLTALDMRQVTAYHQQAQAGKRPREPTAFLSTALSFPSGMTPLVLLPGDTTMRKKRKKYRRKKNLPKKPKTPYTFYQLRVMQDHWDETEKFWAGENRETQSRRVAQLTGQRWRELPVEERKPFIAMAAEDTIRYKEAMAKREADHPPTMTTSDSDLALSSAPTITSTTSSSTSFAHLATTEETPMLEPTLEPTKGPVERSSTSQKEVSVTGADDKDTQVVNSTRTASSPSHLKTLLKNACDLSELRSHVNLKSTMEKTLRSKPVPFAQSSTLKEDDKSEDQKEDPLTWLALLATSSPKP